MYKFADCFLNLSLVRFVLTGVLNTLVGLGVIFVLKWALQLNDTLANLIGYGVGLVVSYLVNSRWTFRYGASLLQVLPRYLLVIVLAYLSNLACVHFCIRQLQLNAYLAQSCGVVPYAGLSYLLLRFWVFRNHEQRLTAETARRTE